MSKSPTEKVKSGATSRKPWVEGHEDLISAMTNHPKDRHVLAAAVRCHAEVIVTHNVKDFPRTALEPYSITVLGPSTFLRNLYEIDPEFVADTLEIGRAHV